MADENNSGRSILGAISWALLGVFGLIYLLNPGAGILEFIPDNVPLVGNLDEATATYLVLAALKRIFGIDFTPKARAKSE